MERRTLLFGTGVTIAATMAGCMGSDDDDDGNGSGTASDPGDDDDYDDDDRHEKDDVPGVDDKKVHDKDEIKRVKRDGKEVKLTIEFDPKREYTYEKLVEKYGDELREYVDDPYRFKEKIDTIRVKVVDPSGETILSFYVNVAWIVDYLRGRLDRKEYYDKVKKTAEYDDKKKDT